MSDSTIYRLLEPRDSEAAAAMMRRNRFFFGKLDPELTAERYDLLQKMKGYLLGIGAEIDGQLVAMLCLYRAGADRTANPRQVFGSALLVDAAHRARLYSFSNMYRRVLQQVEANFPDVREVLLEVYRENLPSLYMQRMFGAALLDESMPNPEEFFIHNYGPSIRRFFKPMVVRSNQRLEASLVPFDKSKVKEYTPLWEERFVRISHMVGHDKMDMWCNIFSGSVCRITSDTVFCAGLEEGGLFVENRSGSDQKWRVTPEGREESPEDMITVVRPGERVHLDLPADMEGFVLSQDDSLYCFYLHTGEDWDTDRYNPEPAAVPEGQPLALKPRTGLLTATAGGEVRFHECWPYLTSPYLFGTVIPDPERTIKTREEGGETVAEESRRGFTMERRYRIAPAQADVHTAVTRGDGKDEDFDPAFALHLQDMEGECEFLAKDGSVTKKTFDYVRDLDVAHDEVIVYEFKKEEYAAKELEKITLSFAGSTWQMSADRPFRAYLHSNYIFIRFFCGDEVPGGWEWKDGTADLGTVRIEQIEKEEDAHA